MTSKAENDELSSGCGYRKALPMRGSNNRRRARPRKPHMFAMRRGPDWPAPGGAAIHQGCRARCRIGADRALRQEASVPTTLWLPGFGSVHQPFEAFASWRQVEHGEIVFVAVRIDSHKCLIEKRIFGGTARSVDHKIRTGFPEGLGGTVDQDANVLTNPQINGAGMGIGGVFC